MARKVITTQEVLQATGPVVRGLGQWLTTRDHGITAKDVERMLEAALVDGEWRVSLIGIVCT